MKWDWWTVTKYIIIGFILVYLLISTIFYISQANYIISTHFEGQTCEFGSWICGGLRLIGFPDPLLTSRSIIPYVVVPFVVVSSIIYLFIPHSFKVHSKLPSLVISLGATLGMVYSGVFSAGVAVALVFLGHYAFTLFLGIFILNSMSIFVDIYRRAKRGITGAEEEIINAEAAFARFQDVKRKWNEMAQNLPIDEKVKKAYFKEIEEIERLFNKGELFSASQRVMQLERRLLGRMSK
ncbi:MAG: hypothetical protein NZ942_01365 [Candidatus Aenigmarchaeota archaeon]|nr:hypothetical protein [Candidatus Aenigmarchaeota archaeon]